MIAKDWQCPWCYTSPFIKPGTHVSISNGNTLIENTLTSALIQSITETLEQTIRTSIPSIDITKIQDNLEGLTKEITEFKEQSVLTHPPLPLNLSPPGFYTAPVHSPKVLKCTERPYDEFRKDYLPVETFDELNDLVGYLKDSSDFIDEKGHSVKLYGQPYSYTGSRSNSPDIEPIPDILNKVIDKVTSDLALKDRPNSVLINHYPGHSGLGMNRSHLAMHSDDESCILADSKIITLSIGASRKVIFEPKHNGKDAEQVELLTVNNSMYAMSRESQNWFKHGVPPVSPDDNSQDSVDDRFSITLRTLQNQFKRSVLVIGDSNTKNIKFGDGSGKVGKSFPGKRVKASQISNIDPGSCVGYANVFIMCGTNNLRCEYIKQKSDVTAVVDQLKDKLIEIKQLCPKVKLFVIPVMPSRIPKMNHNIGLYNELVDQMLFDNFPDVWFEGIYNFLDNKGLLSIKLTRQNDEIHLNDRGIAKLVTYMKSCVFWREKSESSKLDSLYQESTQEVGSLEPT